MNNNPQSLAMARIRSGYYIRHLEGNKFALMLKRTSDNIVHIGLADVILAMYLETAQS